MKIKLFLGVCVGVCACCGTAPLFVTMYVYANSAIKKNICKIFRPDTAIQNHWHQSVSLLRIFIHNRLHDADCSCSQSPYHSTLWRYFKSRIRTLNFRYPLRISSYQPLLSLTAAFGVYLFHRTTIKPLSLTVFILDTDFYQSSSANDNGLLTENYPSRSFESFASLQVVGFQV